MIILLWQGCNYYNQYKDLLSKVATLQQSEMAFKQQRLKDSSTLVTQEAVLLTQEEAIKMGLIQNADRYGKVQSQVTTKTKIVIDSVFMPYTPPNYVDTSGWAYKFQNGDTSAAVLDSVLENSIIVPQSVEKSDNWFSMRATIVKDGLLVDSIRISNQSSVTIGYQKTGFLNLGRKQVVDITNSNPYLSTESMRNVVIKPNKSLLNNKFFWAGVGFTGAIFILK